MNRNYFSHKALPIMSFLRPWSLITDETVYPLNSVLLIFGHLLNRRFCINQSGIKLRTNVSYQFIKIRVLNFFINPKPFNVDESTHNNHRSEEHTSELQSRPHLVCRLLLEKKKDE